MLWSEDIEEPAPWTPSIGGIILRRIEVLRSGHITVREDGIWDYGALTGRPDRETGF